MAGDDIGLQASCSTSYPILVMNIQCTILHQISSVTEGLSCENERVLHNLEERLMHTTQTFYAMG